MPLTSVRFPSALSRVSRGAVAPDSPKNCIGCGPPTDLPTLATVLHDILSELEDDSEDDEALWRSHLTPEQFSRNVSIDRSQQLDVERLMQLNSIFRCEGKSLAVLQELYLSKAFDHVQNVPGMKIDSKITPAEYLQMFRGEHDRIQQ